MVQILAPMIANRIEYTSIGWTRQRRNFSTAYHLPGLSLRSQVLTILRSAYVSHTKLFCIYILEGMIEWDYWLPLEWDMPMIRPSAALHFKHEFCLDIASSCRANSYCLACFLISLLRSWPNIFASSRADARFRAAEWCLSPLPANRVGRMPKIKTWW